jgi:hypothetical protein
MHLNIIYFEKLKQLIIWNRGISFTYNFSSTELVILTTVSVRWLNVSQVHLKVCPDV